MKYIHDEDEEWFGAWIIFVLLMVVLLGCSSKKKFSERFKVEYAKTQQNNIVTNDSLKIESNTKSTKVYNKIEYSPIDPDKPMSLPDGTTSTNVKITLETGQQIDTTTSRTTKNKKVVDNSTVSEKGSSSGRTTDVDAERVSLWPWLVGGIVVLLGFGIWIRFKK